MIVNDWQRMPALTADPELAEDLDAMEEQLLRCKEIVSKILTSSGEMRGEGAGPTTVARFFDALVEDWRTSRWPPALHYDNRFAPDQAIATDAVLAQGIANVFDNALEASPDWMSIVLGRDGDAAVLTVEDRGPGFADRILAQFGKPYQTTKTRRAAGSACSCWSTWRASWARGHGGEPHWRRCPCRRAPATDPAGAGDTPWWIDRAC